MREHGYVVADIADALAPFCVELTVPATPSVRAAPTTWHLGTRITGRLRDPDTTALDLAALLHPTPAVCGTPTVSARRVIAELEGTRGFYAGAVGWCHADGEWRVAIRGGVLTPDGRGFRAHADGGIVADSTPEGEVVETRTKLAVVLGMLGLDAYASASRVSADTAGTTLCTRS